MFVQMVCEAGIPLHVSMGRRDETDKPKEKGHGRDNYRELAKFAKACIDSVNGHNAQQNPIAPKTSRT